MVCFIGKDVGTLITQYPDINSAYNDAETGDNLFLWSQDAMLSFEVGRIYGSDDNNCYNLTSERIEILLKSKGDSVEILNVR